MQVLEGAAADLHRGLADMADVQFAGVPAGARNGQWNGVELGRVAHGCEGEL